jgi:hypothetical protein
MYPVVNFILSYCHGVQNELNKMQGINMMDQAEGESAHIKIV